MFLATTADQSFWQTDKKILFLGEWCLLFNKRHEWQKLNYEVMDYPWNNPQRLKEACDYCDQVYEKLLEELTAEFNSFFHVDKSTEYWRIIVGEWLWRYIQIVYDRYTLIKTAFNQKNVTTTLLDEGNYQYAQSNMDFLTQAKEDGFNLQMFSKIIRLLGYNFSVQRLNKESTFTEHKQLLKSNLKTFLKGFLLRNPFDRSAEIVIDQVYPESAEFNVWLNENGKKVSRLKLSPVVVKAPDQEKRKRISQKEGDDEFERICYSLMEECLPLDLLEGYEYCKSLCDRVSNTPKMILSAVGWRFDVAAAVYIAEMKDKGAKLVGVQHGGGYGSFLHDPMCTNEIKCVDKYISWGWKNNEDKVVALSQPNLSQEINSRSREQILYMSSSAPRYHFIFQSSQIGPQNKKFIDWQLRFLKALAPKDYQKLLVRLYRYDMGWNNKERLMEKFADVKIDDMRLSSQEQFAKSRLIVIDNNQTAYLEALATGVPVILFWDESMWSLTQEASEKIEQLKKVNVFHASPEAAAAFIEQKIDGIEGWWTSVEVQKAVGDFQQHFARKGNWQKDWESFINQEGVNLTLEGALV